MDARRSSRSTLPVIRSESRQHRVLARGSHLTGQPSAMPTISIILPTHIARSLAEALASIQSQTYPDWETVIVDDASTPPVVLDRPDPRIRVLRQTVSQGGAVSKNTGIHAATGEILAFLDDDDRYAPGYLERALGVLDRHPEFDVVFMGVSFFGGAAASEQDSYAAAMAKTLADTRATELEPGVLRFAETLVDTMLEGVPMAFQRPVVRTAALSRIGIYCATCPHLWDCDWAIRAALNARTTVVLDGLYQQRAEGQGYSSRSDRRLEHLDSNIEIKDRLLRDSIQGHHARFVDEFRRAAAQAGSPSPGTIINNGRDAKRSLPVAKRTQEIQSAQSQTARASQLAVDGDRRADSPRPIQ
jgi:glycosyltransferase involved in cell wall biosynthesis